MLLLLNYACDIAYSPLSVFLGSLHFSAVTIFPSLLQKEN